MRPHIYVIIYTVYIYCGYILIYSIWKSITPEIQLLKSENGCFPLENVSPPHQDSKKNWGIPAWTPQVSREKYPHPHIHHTGWEWYPVSPVLDCNPNSSLNKVWLKISRNPPISLQVMVKSSFWTLLLLDSSWFWILKLPSGYFT